jgi:diadenylate cyclase
MLEGLRRLISDRSFLDVLRDLVDIIIVTYVIYRALLVLRGTRAMQMGIGLGIVFLVYLGAKLFKLVTLLNLLSWLLSSIILIVIVVFQNDIRRALIRMGGRAWFTGGREQQSRVIDEVVAAATELARHRMGAIIAFEQDANILEFVKSEGIVLESTVTRELLVSLFVPESVNKLHDGAVLIRDLKIARAGVFFPMPETKILDASLGSRHRAALGITEETDAVVVVVSEERGTISFCFSGNIVSNLDGQSLRHALLGLFGRSSRKKRMARKGAPASTPAPVSVSAPTAARANTPMPASRSAITLAPPPMAGPTPSTKTPIPKPASTPMRSASEPMERMTLERSKPALLGDRARDEASASGPSSSDRPALTPRPPTFVPAAAVTMPPAPPAEPISTARPTPTSGTGGSTPVPDAPPAQPGDET